MTTLEYTFRVAAPQQEVLTFHTERVTYKHYRGLRGLLTRLRFNRPVPTGPFIYRQVVTRWHLEPAFRHRLALLVSSLLASLLWHVIRRSSLRG